MKGKGENCKEGMGFRVIKGKIKIGKMMKIVEEDRNCVI